MPFKMVQQFTEYLWSFPSKDLRLKIQGRQVMMDKQTFEWYEPQTPNEIIDQAIKEHGLEKLYCLFSGGKDSVCIAHYVATNYPKQFAGVVFTNTGLGSQETRKFVINYCKKMGWKLHMTWADNRKRFVDIVLSHGFATAGSHRIWMSYLKFHSWHYFAKDRTKRFNEKMAFISGVRKKESRQRAKVKKYSKTPVDINAGHIFIKPFLYKNGEQLWKYFIENDLEKTPVYQWLNRSGECYCGAFTQVWDLKLMEKYDPLAFETIKYYEKLIQKKGTEKAKKNGKWGERKLQSTDDVSNQQTMESFFDDIIVNDDLCGESCMVES